MRGRIAFQTWRHPVQGHQHVLILVPQTLLQERRHGPQVELGELRQLERRHRAIARLHLGNGGPRQAERVGDRLLTEASGLARYA